MSIRPRIAISLGDIHGIGPEIVLKTFDRTDLFDFCIPVVYGSAQALRWYQDSLGIHVPLQDISDIREAKEGQLGVVDTGGTLNIDDIGRPTAESGRLSIAAIRAAFTSVYDGNAHALVTAPISKEAIGMAGSDFHGHTEMLASFCGCEENVIMIMSSNTTNIGLVTTHVPLSDVTPLITTERVVRTVRLGHRAMEDDFAIEQPRISLLALNPHAGDGGYLGSEEEDILLPAINTLIEEGIDIDGPHAADGFFSAHNKDLYDLIIAMYHDQGLIPFKLQAMGRGVNVTSGLPIVRTSPAHGTAFDIASHGIASAESMKEAVYAARSIALNRMP